MATRESPSIQESGEEQEQQVQRTGQGIVFAVFLLGYQILVICLYGFLYGYEIDTFKESVDVGGMLLTSVLTLVTVAGFGLVNAYITKSSVTGMTFTLLIFVLTIQHFFLFRAFWDKAGVNDPEGNTDFGTQGYNKVTFSNAGVDRQTTFQLPSASFTDAIACGFAMIVCVTAVIGRVGLFQIFLMSLLGTFFYELNSQLFWRLYITDAGYGLRILIFGSMMGIISAFMLGRRETTYEHRQYRGLYTTRALSLVGFALMLCGYPFFIVAGVYTQTQKDNYIIYAACINTWISIMAGLIGSFLASSFRYQKFSPHDLIFSGLAGAFVFSSSADLNFNPAVPLVVGSITGFLSSINHTNLLRASNNEGVLFTYSVVQRFLLPGILAGLLAAILHGVGEYINGGYESSYTMEGRTKVGQGAFQLLGIVLPALFGAICGVIVGLVYRFVNNFDYFDQFNYKAVYLSINHHFKKQQSQEQT